MNYLGGNSFLWVVIAAFVLAIIYGSRAFFGYQRVNQDAIEDYAYRQENNMLPRGLTKEAFLEAYKRVYGPRHLFYVFAAMAGVIILTWPALRIVQFLLEQIWHLNDRSDVFLPGYLVWKVMLFFSLIGFWTFLAYLSARFYHSRAPGTFESEIARRMENEGY